MKMKDKNIVCGAPIERLTTGTLGDLLLLLLNVHDENVLQVDVSTGEELRANLLLSRAISLAKWLLQNNVGVGDSVSVISENRLEFCTVPVACFFVGATFAPLNPEYTPGELKHVLNLSKPKIIFTSQTSKEKITSMAALHPFIKHIVLFGKTKSDNTVLFEDIIGGCTGQDIDESFEPVAYDPKEVTATILCSSGTTGLPKGVMCTHDSMTAYCDIARELFKEMLENDDPTDAMMGLIPFFHSFGFMTMFLNILRGKTMIVLSKFKPKIFLDAIVDYKISRLIVPPPVLLFLVKHPLVKEYDLSSLKEVRSGAAPMGRATEMELRTRFKIDHVSQGYGMTETTLGVLIHPVKSAKIGSVGQIVPGMMAKIIDENGKTLGPYEEGELCLKGPLIMKGYVGDEASTNNCIDRENWLHTGDVAYYDSEKFFFIVDRLKELIKYKAYQVAPAELEALLVTHPAIEDAAVIGLPDEDAGELPLAYIVRKSGKEVSADAVKKFVADNVSPQKQLRGGVIFLDAIPRNPTGKILRRVLRERAKTLKSKL